MPFNCSLDMQEGIATITLAGELDASAAPAFQEQVLKAVDGQARQLVLVMHDLDYLSSAGIRGLVFAKQKMGPAVDVHLVGARQEVLESIQLTGLHQSLIIRGDDAEEGEST